MPPTYRSITSADLQGKRVLLRAGFDVPIENGAVTDDTRIKAVTPTMKYILDHGASLIIMAHQGRPKDAPDPAFSQQPLVKVLETLLERPVHFASDCVGTETEKMASDLKPGEVLLLENLRFHPEEKKNEPSFADQLARLGDVYVQDAFSNSHRNHASMVGVAERLPAYMGLGLEQEVSHLDKALHADVHPLILVLGGAKLETKIPILSQFLEIGDHILLGGSIANTFLKAQGMPIGRSKFDEEGVMLAKELLAKRGRATIHLPVDGVMATAPDAEGRVAQISDVHEDEAIFDAGPDTSKAYADVLTQAKMVIWNGPLGYFEMPAFSESSKRIAEAIKTSTASGAVTVIGGGDTIDVHNRYGLSLDGYTFVSMGGGAMLEYLSGKEMPSINALREK